MFDFDEKATRLLSSMKVEFIVALIVLIEMLVAAIGGGNDILRVVASVLFELSLFITACVLVAVGEEVTFWKIVKIVWLAICWFLIAFLGTIILAVSLMIVFVCYGIGQFILIQRKEGGYTNPLFPKDVVVLCLLVLAAAAFLLLNCFGFALLSSATAFVLSMLIVAISMIRQRLDMHFFVLHTVVTVFVIVTMLVYPVAVAPILIVLILINISLNTHEKFGNYNPGWLNFE